VLPGVNDLASLYPDLAEGALGWDPSKIHAGSWDRRKWVCAEGHSWSAPIGERVRGSGCPACAGRTVEVGFNDLATTHPKLAAEADGWDPTTVSRGHIGKLPWRCSEGHTWSSPPNNRSQGVGCPTCANYGFKSGAPGWLYLIRQSELGLLQVGITNKPDQRMSQHARRRWELVDLMGPMPGEAARALEQQILESLRTRSIATGTSADLSKFDGFTESWRAVDLSAKNLTDLLSQVGIQ
jgi:hypothetical protein